MKAENSTKIQFDSLSVNEAFARGAAARLSGPGMTPPYPSWPISRQPFQKPSPTASSTLTRTGWALWCLRWPSIRGGWFESR